MSRGSRAPRRPPPVEVTAIDRNYQTTYFAWEQFAAGWRVFAEVEAIRVARGWGAIEVFCWFAAYGGAWITFRRLW